MVADGDRERRAARRACPRASSRCSTAAATTSGSALVRHPLTKAVGFTGSLRGGRALMDAAAARPEPIPVYAEMGSINPRVRPARRRSPSAAGRSPRGCKASVTLGVGQFCTCPGSSSGLEGDATRKFVDERGRRVRRRAAGTGTMLYAGIRDAYEQGVQRVREGAGREARSRSRPSRRGCAGGSAAGGAVRDRRADVPRAPGAVATRCSARRRCVVTGKSREEMLEVARNLAGHLTATIHGTPDDLREYADLVAILQRKVGRLVFNGFPTGIEPCPSVHHGGPYPATQRRRADDVDRHRRHRAVHAAAVLPELARRRAAAGAAERQPARDLADDRRAR